MLRALVLEGAEIRADRVQQTLTRRETLRERFAESVGAADLLLVPSAAGAAPAGLERTGDPRFSLLWTYLGCPSLTLPAALSQSGLPLGLQLVARPGEDARLLAAAAQIESILDFHRLPTPPE